MTRRQSRQVAVQILYQMSVGLSPEDACASFWANFAESPHDVFADALVHGTQAKIAEIDAKITALSQHWRLERILKINLAILRLGVHELLHTTTPRAVVIDEAIELAKHYGADTGFINGILDRVTP